MVTCCLIARVKEKLFHSPGLKVAVINQDEAGVAIAQNLDPKLSIKNPGSCWM